MNYRIDRPGAKRHDVFNATQFAPGTFLEALLGADYIEIDANHRSEVHRHNNSENVILILSGSATLVLDESEVAVLEGDRVYIGSGSCGS